MLGLVEECWNNADPLLNDCKHFSLLGQITLNEIEDCSPLYVRISCPGPQYLHFLENNLLDMCDKAKGELAEGFKEKDDKGTTKVDGGCAFHFKGREEDLQIFGMAWGDFLRLYGQIQQSNHPSMERRSSDAPNGCNISPRIGLVLRSGQLGIFGTRRGEDDYWWSRRREHGTLGSRLLSCLWHV
jgi:hypothetical protein